MRKTAPTQPKDRIIELDVLRGFALFGVLLVNVFGYNASFFDFSGFYAQFGDPLNSQVFSLIVNYAADKFIGLFSLLFGIGFFLQYQKLGDSEKGFFRFYMRRLGILFVFGLAHILFFWAGDILLSYSLMGILLLLSRKMPSGLLLPLAFFLYFSPVLYLAFRVHFPFLPDSLSSTADIALPEVKQIYASSAFPQIFALRVEEYLAFRYINLLYYAPKIIAFFLFGFLFGKLNVLSKMKNAMKLSLSAGVLLLSCGILMNTFTSDLVGILSGQPDDPYATAIYMGVYEITNLFLLTSYILLFMSALGSKAGLKVFGPLQYAGRLSLTNYILYSVLFTSLMYSYGFGKFMSFAPFELVLMAVLTFIALLFLCKLYLKHFRFGPLEWLWRKLTY